MRYNLIVASDPDGVIGYNGTLPWYFKEDLAFFKQQTLNSVVVMGRKTWDSLLVKPLPNRLNIVVSKTMYAADNPSVLIVPDIKLCKDPIEMYSEIEGIEDVYFIGGASVYEWAAENVKLDNIYLTLMKKKYKGDTHLSFIGQYLDEMDTEVLLDCEHYTRYRLYR